MALRMASFLRQAQLDVYRKSTTPEYRALVAMARILSDANTPGASQPRKASRSKRAYTARDLTMAIDSLIKRDRINEKLMADGHDPVPNIDWGRIIIMNARKYAQVAKVDLEDFVGELFADLLAGERARTIRDTGSWRNNILGEIEQWARQGFEKSRMEASLTKFIKNKAHNMLRTEQLRVNPDAGFDSGDAPEDSRGSGRLFESLFTLDGITKSMMSNWTSLSQRNPVIMDLVRRISDHLARRDDDYSLMFRAYMQDPSATATELMESMVNAKDPQTGVRGMMPLWQALGFKDPADPAARASNKVKFNNRLKQLRKILLSLYPEIESALNDLQFR